MGRPLIAIGVPFRGGVAPPTSSNSTVQNWIDKITLDGYEYPSQAKVDIYTAAFDYADTEGLTTEIDLLGLLKVENQNLCKIPFIHSGGVAKRFSLVGTVSYTANSGIKATGVSTLGYLNCDWNQFTNGVKWRAGNSSIGVFINDNLNITASVIGCNESAVNFINNEIYPRSSGNLAGALQSDLFSGTGVSFSSAIASSIGFSVFETKTTSAKSRKNGAVIENQVIIASSTLADTNTFVLTSCTDNVDNGVYYTGEVSFFYAGSGDIDQTKMNIFVNLLLL